MAKLDTTTGPGYGRWGGTCNYLYVMYVSQTAAEAMAPHNRQL